MALITFSYDQSADARGEGGWASALPRFREAVSRQYYDGDVTIDEPAGDASVRLDGAQLGTIRVGRFISPAGSTVIRNWHHIRQDPAAIFLIWFMKHGSFSVTQSGRHALVGAGEFAITSSTSPFRIATMADASGHHESYQVVVPAHLLASILPSIDTCCARVFGIETGAARIAYEIFTSLFSNAEALPADCAARLADEALRAIALATERACSITPVQTKEDPLRTVQDYIRSHLGERDLTAARVAAACRMSVRRLHMLFADGPSSFHDHVWNSRLDHAHTLLTDSRFECLQIAEIAYLEGFKSAAHFSRAFRARFGCTPRGVRRGTEAPDHAVNAATEPQRLRACITS